MDPGSFFSFITALLLAYEPVKRLANLNATLQEGLAGAERLFAMLDLKPGIKENPNARDLTIKNGGIQLKNITFSYVDEQKVLNNISLNIPSGNLVALVGPSGSGKSTILNLIPRFFDVDAGNITIDGSELREITFASLRKNIGLVSQEITLFDDTIKANISYGQPTASEEKITEAAKNALAHDFIMEMPEGYETYVGEQGVKLSGGQRQRLAIARAMLKDAPILLLDEATTSLDAHSQSLIQQA